MTELRAEKLIVIDVQERFMAHFRPGLLQRIRRATRRAHHVLVISDATGGEEAPLVRGDRYAVKEYGGFCRQCIDAGLEEDLVQCVRYLLAELPIGEHVPDSHHAIASAYREWPDLMEAMQSEYSGRFPQMVAEEEWVQGLPNSLLGQYDGAVLCGGGRRKCLEEVRLAMRCMGIDATVEETLCYG